MPIRRVMVAGISASRQYLKSYKSFAKIEVREGDGKFEKSGGRGDVNRTHVCQRFLADDRFDALMLCDLDQIFPSDTLERLRSHDLDMVSGHYMKRTTKHLLSIWQSSVTDEWPYMPFLDPPTEGLHKLASSGFGCVLIKRKVIEAVADLLPHGANPFEIGRLPEAAFYQTNFGSDYRF
ncbi:MAG: hypothetical protein ACYSP9_05850, partial [Planctomycetota bacterium]